MSRRDFLLHSTQALAVGTMPAWMRHSHAAETEGVGRVVTLGCSMALSGPLGAAGLEHPQQLGPEHIVRRVSPVEVRSLATLYSYLEPGELLDRVPAHAVFKGFWADARSDSFAPPARIAALRETKSR